MIGHLIHVGYPKTGSNFLRRWFGAHPQLAYRAGALAGYRNVYEMLRDAVVPRKGILYRVTSSEGFTAPRRDAGQAIQRPYDDWEDPTEAQASACSSLASLFPNAHVLIVTRGFRSMILSSFSQYARCGGDATLEELLRGPLIEDAWDYDRVVGMYRNAFGADNVMVMPYELLRDDAEHFVRKIEERLGLAHCPTPPERMNTSLSPVEMYWYPRISRAVRRLPIGSRLKRVYLRGTFANGFRPAIALLQRIRPGTPVTPDAIPDHVIAAYRVKAQTLRHNPLYTAYARDYSQPEF
jgi:hypothetical protein